MTLIQPPLITLFKNLWILESMPTYLHFDDHGRNEHTYTLHQVSQNVDKCSTHVDINLVLPCG